MADQSKLLYDYFATSFEHFAGELSFDGGYTNFWEDNTLWQTKKENFLSVGELATFGRIEKTLWETFAEELSAGVFDGVSRTFLKFWLINVDEMELLGG